MPYAWPSQQARVPTDCALERKGYKPKRPTKTSFFCWLFLLALEQIKAVAVNALSPRLAVRTSSAAIRESGNHEANRLERSHNAVKPVRQAVGRRVADLEDTTGTGDLICES